MKNDGGERTRRRGRQRKKWSNHLSFESLLPAVPRQLNHIHPPSPSHFYSYSTFHLFHLSFLTLLLKDPLKYLDLPRLTQIPHKTLISGRKRHLPEFLIGLVALAEQRIPCIPYAVTCRTYVLPQSALYLVHSTQFATASTLRHLQCSYEYSSTDRKWTPCMIYKVHIIHPLYLFMAFTSFQPQMGTERCL